MTTECAIQLLKEINPYKLRTYSSYREAIEYAINFIENVINKNQEENH